MFKIYKNKKTRHPSISLKQKDRSKWHNMPMTHEKPKGDTSLTIDDPHPKAVAGDKSYVRRFVRKDNQKIKGHRYKEYVLSETSEQTIKDYLKRKYKKR